MIHICHFFLACPLGHLALQDTRKCQLDGYVCSIGDKEDCCNGKDVETRPCVPCDETRHRKTNGSEYINLGSCDSKTKKGKTL